MLKNIFIARRRYHSSRPLYGWNQNIIVGYGLPLTDTMYQNVQTSKNKCHQLNVKATLPESSNITKYPILYSSKGGYILFSRYIYIREVSEIFDNNIIGPLSKDQAEQKIGDLPFEFNIYSRYRYFEQQLNNRNIDILASSKSYYPEISINPGLGHVENPFNLWLYQNKNKIMTGQLKNFVGYYIIGLC